MSTAPTPSCRLAIKAIPNAPRNAVAGWLGESLKVKVHAPALEGRANDELCEFIASVLGISRRDVSVLQGEKSRQKLIQVDGLTLEAVKARLV